MSTISRFVSRMTVPMLRASGGGGGGSSYSFNMTAGNYFTLYVGYFPAISIGSIDADPFTGEGGNVSALFDYDGLLVFAITGDFTAQFSGKQLYIEGVVYDPGGNCGFARIDIDPPNEVWTMIYTEDGTETGAYPTAYGFVDATEYLIEIK